MNYHYHDHYSAQARKAGLLLGSSGLDAVLMAKTCELRASLMSIPDELAARMPLSYYSYTALLLYFY